MKIIKKNEYAPLVGVFVRNFKQKKQKGTLKVEKTSTGRVMVPIETMKDDYVVVNEVVDDEKDLMQDFVSLVTSFCARLYGKRRTKRSTEKIIENSKKD